MGRPTRPVTRRGFIQGGVGATAALVTGLPVAIQADETAGAAIPGGMGEVPALDEVPLRFRVNDEAIEGQVGPDDSLLKVLRDDLLLTGTKEGCGTGACGACTVHLDGTSVVSCLLPATALEGRTIRTIEGLGSELHPVQRAFLAEDALQCGYCTPGFVMKAVEFYERWRAQEGDREPSRAAVAEEMVGNLCRCGAYEGIYRAIQGACAGRFEEGPVSGARKDGPEKVRGEAVFTADLRLEGMLIGGVLRSPHAHARLLSVDLGEALAVPGVSAAVLLTQPGEVIRFVGQELVALAGSDRAALRAGLGRLSAEYETLPAAVSLGQALQPDAPVVYPEVKKNPGNASEGVILPLPWSGNLRGPMAFFGVRGAAARKAIAGGREASLGQDRLVEGQFVAQAQCHTALESHGAVARWNPDGGLTVWMSTQGVSGMAEDIALRWKVPRDRVQVLAGYVGGGFGAKCRMGMEVVAAVELARATGAPVQVLLDRAEDLTVGGYRPAVEMDAALLAGPDGELEAMELESRSDSGTAVGNNVGALFRVMYPGAAKSLHDYDVTTHTSPAQPFRGPGGPAAYWALEQLVDELATARSEDPLELRRRWDPNPARQELYSVLADHPLWVDRGGIASDNGRFRRGVGLASASWFYFVQPDVQVEVAAGPSGFVVRCAAQDMGNGSRSSLAWTAATLLGLPPEQIRVEIGDSRLPRGPLAAGSRTTASLVPAVEEVTRELLTELAYRHGVRKGLVGVASAEGQGGLRVGDSIVPWSEVLSGLDEVRCVGSRPADPGGWFFPFRAADLVIGRLMAASVLAVEVEVDTLLGQVRPRQVWSGLGVGRLVVPQLARSQAEGGLLQGLGYALFEERRLDPHQGRVLTRDLETYRIPRITDSPEIELHFAASGFESAVGGAVGLGEICTVGVAAAVGNAVHHAIGWRPRVLPITPERILGGLSS
ncbi:MAG: molybdopterin-dependent oxidoreductase [Myxococcota bacterium]|nr:molybdopterin-dependent oxidoreductase [Myxococcota bacterium]